MVKITHLRSCKASNYEFSKGEKIMTKENDHFLVNGFPVGICPKCGEKLVIRKSKYGKFVACEGYKKGCKNTYNLKNFKAMFDFEVSRTPSQIRFCDVRYSLRVYNK